jgi:phage baseplate assembly protein V
MNLDFLYELAEVKRKLNNLVTLAQVTSINPETARVKVSIGDASESDFLPILSERASGGDQSMWLPEKGDQVLVIALNGDINSGFVLGSILKITESQNKLSMFRKFSNGTSFEYDKEQNLLAVSLAEGAVFRLKASGGKIEIDCTEITLKGNLKVEGEVTAKGIPLSLHTHAYQLPQHPAGPGQTNPPEKGSL